jgi:hypothetical protein
MKSGVRRQKAQDIARTAGKARKARQGKDKAGTEARPTKAAGGGKNLKLLRNSSQWKRGIFF